MFIIYSIKVIIITKANLSPNFLVSPLTLSSLIPRFKTVSSIPGMEMAAPDLTETSRGDSVSPNFLPTSFSNADKAVKTEVQISLEIIRFEFRNPEQTSVVIVKPGGTDRPREHI